MAGGTNVTVKDGSILSVTQTTPGFLIEMSKVRHASVYGANAETPIRLYLSKTSKRCQVRIKSYLYDLAPVKRAD